MAPSLLCEDIISKSYLELADNYDYDKGKVVTCDIYNNNKKPDQSQYNSAKCLQLKSSNENKEEEENNISSDISEVGSRLSYVRVREPDDDKDPPRLLRQPRSNLRRTPSQASMHHTTVPQALKPSTLGSRTPDHKY